MKMSNDPIAAVATPEGPGALALVRVSGAGCWRRLEGLVKPTAGGGVAVGLQRSVQPVFVRWQSDSPWVPGQLLRFPASRSYTGEESAELYVPGSPPLVRSLLHELTLEGVRPAQPGEFTRRAFSNGRLDLTQAEAVAQLIVAEDASRAADARRILEGELGRGARRAGDRLHDLVAWIEAGLDFSEQEVEPPDPRWLADRISEILREVSELVGGERVPIRERPRVRLLLAGRANAGKSTLFNRLVGADVAITSPTPGTTRDPVSFEMRQAGQPSWELVDLAGQRPADDFAERLAQQRGREWIAEGDLVLYVFDATRSPEELVREWEEWPVEWRSRTWPIFNKADRLAARDAAWVGFDLECAARPGIVLSALDGLGVAELESRIRVHVESGDWSSRGASSVFTQRQLDSLDACRRTLSTVAADLLDSGVSAELVVVDLRAAHEFLEELTGAIVTEDTLDRIFKKFCLGK